MYKEIRLGEREAEHFFTPGENVHNELFKVILKHRRFIYGCPAPEEMRTSEGWYFKFDNTMKRSTVCHRIYEMDSQKPVIEDYERRVVRLPCVRKDKQHEVWLIAPGGAALFFFYGGKSESFEYYREKTHECLSGAFRETPGVTAAGNDVLISGGKALGTDIFYNAEYRTLLLTAGVTYNAAAVKEYACSFDYSQKKYSTLSGFKDTGLSAADFGSKIKDFYEAVKCL